MKIIHTDLSLSQIEDRFYTYVKKGSFESYNENGFIGKINNKRFHIRYQKAYIGNSFNIYLVGKIIETNNGCDIKYTCRKNLFVMLFMLIWLSIAIYGFVASLSTAINGGMWSGLPVISIFVIIGLLLFLYIPKRSIIRLENTLNAIVNL